MEVENQAPGVDESIEKMDTSMTETKSPVKVKFIYQRLLIVMLSYCCSLRIYCANLGLFLSLHFMI